MKRQASISHRALRCAAVVSLAVFIAGGAALVDARINGAYASFTRSFSLGGGGKRALLGILTFSDCIVLLPGGRGWYRVYYSILLPLAAVLPLIWLYLSLRMSLRERRIANARCVRCGYDVRASNDRCPECGEPIPPRNVSDNLFSSS